MSLEDEIVKSRKKQTMMEMVASDKLAAKKKILARRARAKLLKEKNSNKSTKYNAIEKEYIKKYGQPVFKGSVPTSDSKLAIKDKVTVTKSNANNTRLQDSKTKEASKKFMQKVALKIKPKWKQYSSISAAKKAGSLYYSKGGKKFAAVFAEDLKGVKGSSPSAKLRAYLNDKEKKRK